MVHVAPKLMTFKRGCNRGRTNFCGKYLTRLNGLNEI